MPSSIHRKIFVNLFSLNESALFICALNVFVYAIIHCQHVSFILCCPVLIYDILPLLLPIYLPTRPSHHKIHAEGDVTTVNGISLLNLNTIFFRPYKDRQTSLCFAQTFFLFPKIYCLLRSSPFASVTG